MDAEKVKEYNKRYYEKKKAKEDTTEAPNPNFIDFELIPEAKTLAQKIMDDHIDNPDFIHSFVEYIEVMYTRFYRSELAKGKGQIS